MYVMLSCTSALFVRREKNYLTVATLVARNLSEAMVRSGTVWSQAVASVLVHLTGIWLQPPLKCFTFHLV
jgi:hypothetical protein